MTHFSFHVYSNDRYNLDYQTFEYWLLAHKETLIHVEISCLYHCRSNRFFNATLFPKLEFLQLSRWQTVRHLRDSRAEFGDLLGPSMKMLCWDFTAKGYNPDISPFGEDEAWWIRTLAETAFERKAALTTLRIKYSLDDHFKCGGMREYPWEDMSNIRNHLSTLGISLVYDNPPVSKDQWMTYGNNGSDPYVNFWKDVRPGSSVRAYKQTIVSNEEEDLKLKSLYNDLLTRGLYHGQDICRYLLPRAECDGCGVSK